MHAGLQIGPLTIEKELGSGAMGTVYLARHTDTGAKVAVKVMLAGLGTNPKAQARFEREADVLKQLRHPNVVRLVASGRYQGKPFYAMEFIEGESLDKILERRGKLSWQETAEIAKQVCAALQHVHDKGILHRDLKPSNIMVTRDGVAKLTDFGIAKDLDRTALTSANYTVGTAAYMSPEQCRGESDIDHRTDLYSLGVMLFELIAGRRPFEADSPVQMLMKHLKAKPPRLREFVPDVPPELDTLIDQLLEKKREHRPKDARTVAQTLEKILQDYKEGKSLAADAAKEVKASSTEEDKTAARALLPTAGPRRPPKRRWTRKHKEKLFLAIGLSAMFLFIMGILIYVIWPDPEKALREAIALYEAGEEAYKAGKVREALGTWYDATRKFELIAANHKDQRAEKALDYLKRIHAATMLNRITNFLEGKDTWEAVQQALAAQSNQSTQFRKDSERIWEPEFDHVDFAQQARLSLGKLEVPWLMGEINKLASVQEPKTWKQAREKMDYFLRRYGMFQEFADKKLELEKIRLRLEAHQFALDWLRRSQPRELHSHPVIETALQALECEQINDYSGAKHRWEMIASLRDGKNVPEDWQRYVQATDLQGWILLAQAKLENLKNK